MAIIAAAAALTAVLPAVTRQGIDYRVTAHRIPAYVKTLDFLQRHHQYQLLVSRICGGRPTPGECVTAIFDWTRANIRPVPHGMPVVDDHPLHVVIRGYGTHDQMADLFTVLATYAGVPAFFRFLPDARQQHVLSLAFAQIDGRWVPFDVERHVVFRRADGAYASVDDLLATPALADAAGGGREGMPYSAFISRRNLDPFVAPATTRGDLQRPITRLRYELRRLIGREAS